ncbi:MAG TPA: SDR family NAD(P)-dependent oxidoreductase, partial [Candidatus Dormibacteraeota bacterium]|nr:SDR family NAD(P)-dependent oxidoreductase [Candidatus Dormibacteraeota bacterium]
MPEGSRFDLTGRVALITGASRGIGSAIATALVEQGAQVVLSSRKQADLDQEAARINAKYPGRATAVAAHAGRQEDLERLVKSVMESHAHIDILVNNAATNPYFGPVIATELPAWDKTFEVNLRGVFILTKLVYEAWMETHGGTVINVASVGGLRPGVGLGAYNVTKA